MQQEKNEIKKKIHRDGGKKKKRHEGKETK